MLKVITLIGLIAVAVSGHILDKRQVTQPSPYSPLQPTLAPASAQLLKYPSSRSARILAYNNEFFPPSSYRYSYETENGISANENGEGRVAGPTGADTGAVVAQGGYQYVSPEGVPVSIQYIADEDGYHPSGVIIPGNTHLYKLQ